jgi:hypothetical protein
MRSVKEVKLTEGEENGGCQGFYNETLTKEYKVSVMQDKLNLEG